MILALDIATRTGWAAGTDRPVTGVIDLSGVDGIGARGSLFLDYVDRMVQDMRPSLVVFEQPLMGGKGSVATMRLLQGLAVAAEVACHWHDTPVREVPMATWRKHFIGRGWAPRGERSDWCKIQAMAKCRQLGWDPKTHDEAEAAGIWHYAYCLKFGADPDLLGAHETSRKEGARMSG